MEIELLKLFKESATIAILLTILFRLEKVITTLMIELREEIKKNDEQIINSHSKHIEDIKEETRMIIENVTNKAPKNS